MSALAGAGIALLGTIVGAVAALVATAYTQRHQDRREKRQRVHASFRRVLLAAGALTAMTRPMGGVAWSEDRMSEEERGRFTAALEESADGLRNAAVDLTLEGIEEPVAAVNELVKRFDDFRWYLRQERRPGVTEELMRVPIEASEAIATIRNQLVVQLPAILDDILPVGRPRARWFGRW